MYPMHRLIWLEGIHNMLFYIIHIPYVLLTILVSNERHNNFKGSCNNASPCLVVLVLLFLVGLTTMSVVQHIDFCP